MNKIRLFSLAILVFLLLLGFVNRKHLYDQLPFPGQSNDEYSNSWVGLSLIELGYPVGISGLAGAYPENDYRYLNVDHLFQRGYSGSIPSINYPWFDHPPFTGLVTGGFSYLKGARVFEDTTASVIRKPMIYLGLVTAALAGLLAYLVFGQVAAWLTLAIYAVSPYAIITSRMIQAENFFVPLFLLSLIGLYLLEKTGEKKYFWLAVVAAGSCLLFKLSGGVAIMSGVLMLLASKRFKQIRWQLATAFALLSGSFILFFVVYGLAFDAGLFAHVLTSNSGRIYGIGANAIRELIVNAKFTNLHYLTDGWYFAGWLSLFAVSTFPFKRSRYLIIPVVSYLGVYLFFGSHPFGWYSYPFIPFLIMATSWLFARALKHWRAYVPAVLISLMIIGVGLYQTVTQDEFANFVSQWRLLMLGLLGLTILLRQNIIGHQKSRLLANILLLGLVVTALYISQIFFNQLDIDSWYRIN